MTVAKYIGHCAVDTKTDDIQKLLVDHNVDIVSLEKLPTKHDRFSSFKLVLKKSQLSIVENPELWPSGIHVGRWWPPKAPTSGVSDKEETRNG